MIRFFTTVVLLVQCFIVFSQNVDSLLSTPVLYSTENVDKSGSFTFTKDYSVTPTTWLLEGFTEDMVFDAELKYESATDENQSYQIRVGKGGQLYSFRGIFGESVPPQWRPDVWVEPHYGGGANFAPWVDEVWQLVAASEIRNNPPDSSYFIHQAGVYLKIPELTEPFFSPIVASYVNEEKMSYSLVSWGQHAHTDDLRNINFRSDVLYYTTYTNIGKGIIQIDNMIYNYGDDQITYLNVPWGGVRNSSLDHFFISTPDNDYENTPGEFGQSPHIYWNTTGGWIAWSNDSLGNSPALAMVQDSASMLKHSWIAFGDAGNLEDPVNLRDYNVLESARSIWAGQLTTGKLINFRYYFVLGANIDSVKNTIIDNNLVTRSFDDTYTPESNQVDSISYIFRNDNDNFEIETNTDGNGLLLKTLPYKNSYPLFKIKSAFDEEVITSELYHFSEYAYDGITKSIKLLGYLDNQSVLTVVTDSINEGEDYTFVDNSTMTDISENQYYISKFSSTKEGYDSLVLTNLKVKPIETDIDNYNIISGFNIFPNPSQGIVNIATTSNEKYLVEIFDLYGNLVFSSEDYIGNSSIDLKGMCRASIYNLKVTAKSGVLSRKLIIQ